MADLENTGGQHRSLKKPPRQMKAVRVDLTPMVDLAFLLITFFMLTTVMSEEKGMWLAQPEDKDSSEVNECRVMHVLIDSAERIFVYEGDDLNTMRLTSFDPDNGVRQELMEKGKRVKAECAPVKGKPAEIICLIKLLPGSRYKSMVNILDEMDITSTKIYALQEPVEEELNAVSDKIKLLLANN